MVAGLTGLLLLGSAAPAAAVNVDNTLQDVGAVADELVGWVRACSGNTEPACQLTTAAASAALDLTLACAEEARRIAYELLTQHSPRRAAACSASGPLEQLTGCLDGAAGSVTSITIINAPADTLNCGGAVASVLLAARGVADVLTECLGVSNPLPPGSVLGKTTLSALCVDVLTSARAVLRTAVGCVAGTARTEDFALLGGSEDDTLACGTTFAGLLGTVRGGIGVLARCVGAPYPLDPGDETTFQAVNLPALCTEAVSAVGSAAQSLSGCFTAATTAVLPEAGTLSAANDTFDCGPLALAVWDIGRGGVNVLARCLGVSGPLPAGDERTYDEADLPAFCAEMVGTAEGAVVDSEAEVPDLTGDVPVDSAVPPDEGGTSNGHSQRYCGQWQWNDGSKAGSRSRSQVPCLGGSGRDYLVGTATNDFSTYGDSLVGNLGGDILAGGRGDDYLWADKVQGDTQYDGDDTLYGQEGMDKLTGGRGTDTYYGGESADEFFAVDGQRDFIFCNDSVGQAEAERRLKNYDTVHYDRYLDVLDESCKYARLRPV